MATVLPEFRAGRLMSMDAYRGFVMFLMAAEILHYGRISEALPDSGFWRFMAHHQDHVEWFGCTLHDLIQPSFSFLVGVALPYSIASRQTREASFGRMFLQTLRRSLTLILLGIFLRSVGRKQTNFTFEDTLTQIGLGYPFLFLLGFRSARTVWLAFGVIVVGYWLAFVLYPLPGPDFSYEAVGVPADWPYHQTGIAAHFNKNSNLAWAFDTWFLNLFPRAKTFLYNGGGYATLSFIPTLATMILGLQAGKWLRSGLSNADLLKRFLIAGVVGLAMGWLLTITGISPSIKRIWTPGWVFFSGGWCFLLLAAFYYIIDVRQWRGWAFPLVVIGMNSIAIYCLVHLIDHFIIDTFKTHLGQTVFEQFGPYETLVSGGAALLVFWLLLYWMYKKKLFIRV
ncbi:acyltransferase family protein [Larkinella bovis]|uniref:Acyltransferase family protein n=1 Tax=Larkinella bovis TaxID=683041 RepID=A0ABW0IJI1_9BACT